MAESVRVEITVVMSEPQLTRTVSQQETWDIVSYEDYGEVVGDAVQMLVSRDFSARVLASACLSVYEGSEYQSNDPLEDAFIEAACAFACNQREKIEKSRNPKGP